MAARKIRTKLSEEWKEKIRIGMILERLDKHVFGGVELSNTQIRAAEILLKKSLPDLTSAEMNHKGTLATFEATTSMKKAALEELKRIATKL